MRVLRLLLLIVIIGLLSISLFSCASPPKRYRPLSINDNDLLKSAYKIAVLFEDGVEVIELVDNKKGHIIVYNSVRNSIIGFESVTISDKAGKVLFRSD
ncbi:MAG TPA: hypothetical protein VE439_10460 [Anaerolineae bacterium]|jgi:hypothetical protein|nr:hypothetical protein [Anaerolineae bacterium]